MKISLVLIVARGYAVKNKKTSLFFAYYNLTIKISLKALTKCHAKKYYTHVWCAIGKKNIMCQM